MKRLRMPMRPVASSDPCGAASELLERAAFERRCRWQALRRCEKDPPSGCVVYPFLPFPFVDLFDLSPLSVRL